MHGTTEECWGKPNVGDWVQTWNGVKLRILDIKPEDFNIDDIAHALSNQCRFTGHTKQFYSVCEHSIRVCNYIDDTYPGNHREAYAGLMHDASEAYLSDIARPFKNLPEFKFYREIEDSIMHKIAERFEFDWPMSDIVKEADDVLLGTEARDLINRPIDDWHLQYKMLDHKIHPMTPEFADLSFRVLFHVLRDKIGLSSML